MPPVTAMGVIFVLSSRSTLPPLPGLTWDQTAVIGHFLAYALLAGAIWWGLAAWREQPFRRAVTSFVIVMAYAVSDEVHQAFVVGRSPELIDLVVDASGALVSLSVLGRWAPRAPRPPRDSLAPTASGPASFPGGSDGQEVAPPGR